MPFKSELISTHSSGFTQKQKGRFKPVYGPTGSGKTSVIKDIIEKYLNYKDVKFIYISNRIQLLDEMYETEVKHSVYLKNDTDTLISTLNNFDLIKLLDNPIIKKYANYLSKISKNYFDISQLGCKPSNRENVP